MSHRNSCPDEYEARREGERAYEVTYGLTHDQALAVFEYWKATKITEVKK